MPQMFVWLGQMIVNWKVISLLLEIKSPAFLVFCTVPSKLMMIYGDNYSKLLL